MGDLEINTRKDVKAYWSVQPLHTMGRHNCDVEAVEFSKTFAKSSLTNPPKIALVMETSHERRPVDF